MINGLPRILGEMNNLYMAPPPTGYGVGISGIGSRVAYVPQMQDYEYGDLGYDPTVGRVILSQDTIMHTWSFNLSKFWTVVLS